MRSLERLAFWLCCSVFSVMLASAAGAGPGLQCASCHPAQAGPQPETSMARALSTPASNAFLASHGRLTFETPRFRYLIETLHGVSTYTVTDTTGASLSTPIQWVFGNGSQTYVFERGGKYYESLVSYYPAIQALDITMGDQRLAPNTLGEALGRELSEGEAKSCFGCHATGVDKKAAFLPDALKPDALLPGVSCQHCHTSAPAHLAAVAKGKLDSVPARLGKLSSEDISNFCGQCHRSWETVIRNGWHGELDVRFQPYRLANSRCFNGTDPRISCVACHDPHREVVHDTKAYDGKCLACHGAAAATAKLQTVAASSSAAAKSCPVAKENCASCHMPKINLPGGHQEFRDHEIRIVRAGEAYPN